MKLWVEVGREEMGGKRGEGGADIREPTTVEGVHGGEGEGTSGGEETDAICMVMGMKTVI